MRRIFSRFADRVGQPPGAPLFTGKQHMEAPRLTLVEYSADTLRQTPQVSLETLTEFSSDVAVNWLNVDGLHDTDTLSAIGRLRGLHPLVVEDIANTAQRPKIEVFDNYLFLTLKMIRLDKSNELDIEQLSVILGRGWALTFQEKPGDVLDPVRKRIEQSRGRVRSAGADYLAYALIDAVVDHYFLVLEQLGENLEALEDETLCKPDPEVSQRIHHLKRELLLLRKAVWPLREMLGVLIRDEHPLFAAETQPYLRDLYDHTLQAVDLVDTFREMASGLLDMYLSSVSNRMNEVMKVLTIIATIFIPLSFLVGLYGMNFAYMPELHLRWGYFAVLGLCVVLAGGMLLYFRRKKWL